MLIGLALVGASGCTFEDGTGFATLDNASIAARLEIRGSKKVDDRTLTTDLGYEVALETLVLRLGTVTLSESTTTSGGGSVQFDPANPPPQYSLCHAGHCHHEDGRLVDYADIEAELAGGGGTTFTPVVTLPAGDIDGLSREQRNLDTVEPSRELPQASLAQVGVAVESVTLRGRVRSDGSERAMVVETPIGGSLTRSIELEVDGTGPRKIGMHIDVVLPDTLFDGIDFDTQPTLEPTAEDPLVEDLVARLATSALRIDLE